MAVKQSIGIPDIRTAHGAAAGDLLGESNLTGNESEEQRKKRKQLIAQGGSQGLASQAVMNLFGARTTGWW